MSPSEMEIAAQAVAQAMRVRQSLQAQLSHDIACAMKGSDGVELPLGDSIARCDEVPISVWKRSYAAAGIGAGVLTALKSAVEAGVEFTQKDMHNWVTELEIRGIEPEVPSLEMVKKQLSAKGTR
jgi:hypothetical protein